MWALPPTDSVLHVLSFIAVAAQAMTAALAAGRRSMDWVGVCMLGCITALGGGTIRDVLLGHYPLLWVQHPSFLLLAAGAALVTILMAQLVYRLNTAFLVLDAIGLVVFTMAGCDVAWQVDVSLPLVIVVVAGMITGCAGGVLRDILCNEVPLLFRAELYATVSIVTGLVYSVAFALKLNQEVWTALTFVLGLTLRLLAIRYKWEMPKFVFSRDATLNPLDLIWPCVRCRPLWPSPPARHCPRNCGCRSRHRRCPDPTVLDRPASIPCWARAASSRSAAPSRMMRSVLEGSADCRLALPGSGG